MLSKLAASAFIITVLLASACAQEGEAPSPSPGPTPLGSTDDAFCHGHRDGATCNDGNPCTSDDVCGLGVCKGHPVEDGASCEDGDKCTTGGQCQGAVCVSTPVVCAGHDARCAVGSCSADTGECVTLPFEDGTACDDGLLCTLNDSCTSGTCGGATRDCAVLDSDCTKGTCSASTGECVAAPVRSGAECDDGNPCTSAETCRQGECLGLLKDCSSLDGDCVIGECNEETGACGSIPRADGTQCTDGVNCTSGDVCTAGVCGGSPLDCSSLDGLCLVGVCQESAGACGVTPRPDETPCNDSSACTGHDVCESGVCSGTTALCDACSGRVAGAACDDQDACTTGETCQQSGGLLICGGAATVSCAGLDGPCSVGVCQPASGACEAIARGEGASCDDGAACTGNDTCSAGACAGAPIALCGAVVAECEGPSANDLVTAAVPVALVAGEATLLGRADPAGETDWYELTLLAGERLTVTTSAHCGLPMDTRVGVVDGSGTLLALNDDTLGPFAKVAGLEVPAAGTYYVSASTYEDSGVGTYLLEFTVDTPPPCVDDSSCGCAALTCSTSGPDAGKCVPRDAAEVEPNDGALAATPLLVERTMGGDLSTLFEEDWYGVTLTAGVPVSFATSDFCSSTADPALSLFAPDGTTLLGYDGDGGGGGQARLAPFTPDTTGLYYVRVADEFTGTGRYVLTVEDLRCLATADCTCADEQCPSDGVTPAVCEAKLRAAEPAPGAPAPLALGARTASRLDEPFDVDRYALALEPGTYSTATVSYCGAELDTVLTLRDGLGALVATDDDGGDGFFSALTFTVSTSATYTIEVRANGGATGDYIVVIGAEP